MADADLEAQAGGAAAEANAARERARAEIRLELERRDAHEHARHALEVMAESYLRFVRSAGPRGYRIVDDQEKPRMHYGNAANFTIGDLVADLRERLPALFKDGPRAPGPEPAPAPAPGPASEAAAEPEAAPPPPPEPASPPEPPPPPVRDWLHLAAAGADDGATVSPDAGIGLPAAPRLEERVVVVRPEETTPAVRLSAPDAERAWQSRLTDALESAKANAAGAAARVAKARFGQAQWQRLRGSLPRVSPQILQRLQTWQAAAVAAFLVGILGVLLARALLPSAPEPAEEARTTPAPQADAAPPPAAATPLPSTPPPSTPNPAPPAASAASPAPPPAAPDPAPPRDLRGVPEVIDTATLRLEGKLVHLFGVDWDRGGVGEELSSYLRGRAVTCKPAGVPDTYRCTVEGRDLSQVVLYNGGGRAASGAPPELVDAESHARAEKLGVWGK